MWHYLRGKGRKELKQRETVSSSLNFTCVEQMRNGTDPKIVVAFINTNQDRNEKYEEMHYKQLFSKIKFTEKFDSAETEAK
jgi:hypothetical protein